MPLLKQFSCINLSKNTIFIVVFMFKTTRLEVYTTLKLLCTYVVTGGQKNIHTITIFSVQVYVPHKASSRFGIMLLHRKNISCAKYYFFNTGIPGTLITSLSEHFMSLLGFRCTLYILYVQGKVVTREERSKTK